MREDTAEMNQKRRIAIAIVVISEESELFLGCEITLLFCSCLDKFFEHIANFFVGEGEATNKELREKKKQRFEFIFIILARLQSSVELLADILHYHRGDIIVLLIQPCSHLHWGRDTSEKNLIYRSVTQVAMSEDISSRYLLRLSESISERIAS